MKYNERICETSKTSISVMFCGSATGKILPPYVVYKATRMWDTWMSGGPEKTRYQSTKSGWFDGPTFEDWFIQLFLPYVKRNRSSKPVALIGDNLSSHISFEIVRLCSENDIRFICLPPNSTHLTQPLDVAFFGPIKKKWREVLDKWRMSKSSKKHSVLPKECFPMLLKQVMDILGNGAKDLESGFRKAGIVPLNKDQVLNRVTKPELNLSACQESFLSQLKAHREDFLNSSSAPRQRRKKVNVVPGQSVTPEDFNNNELVQDKRKKPQNVKNQRQNKTKKPQRKKTCKRLSYQEDSSDDSDESLVFESEEEVVSVTESEEELSSGYDYQEEDDGQGRLDDEEVEDAFGDPEDGVDGHVSEVEEEHKIGCDRRGNSEKCKGSAVKVTSVESICKSLKRASISKLVQKKKKELSYSLNEFVVIQVNKQNSIPGQILSLNCLEVQVSCMEKKFKFWRWPDKDEIRKFKISQILRKIDPLKVMSVKRNQFSIPFLDDFTS